ncbi:hypothetical protein N3K66_003761 [Trichothecium roseum]|uniref:Uncharacterized protein n=1 Tax=Trichothecium roseum TaxID=47278 RepID=A0ACC0V6G8_9HYPO|nr:hypothetical protein N3K66_003761 [Trichothecium roseum]
MPPSSQEYLITKVGMAPPHTKRSKPIRTYGKRSQETKSDPAARKRRAVDETEAENLKESGHVLVEKKNPPQPDTKEDVDQEGEKVEGTVKKGSIMNYFKPAPAPTPAELSKDAAEAEPREEEAVSSPVLSPRSRRSRRFGVREPTVDHSTTNTASETEGPPTTRGIGRRGSRRIAEGARRKMAAASAATTTKAGLAVQTTLNISSQATFTECKRCNTVYNPLYPGDVRYHTKRHAAILRAKRKDEGSSIKL